MQTCLCGLNTPFAQCCQPILNGDTFAQTPEQLMRSRYSAFVQKNSAYLIKTHLAADTTIDQEKALSSTFANTQWLGLRVLSAATTSATEGQVEFAAFFRDSQTELGQIHELSRFVRQDEHWFYVDGRFLPPLKLERNAPCFCGSGNKFKKCCGR